MPKPTPPEETPKPEEKPKSIAEEKAERKARREQMQQQFEKDRQERFRKTADDDDDPPADPPPKPEEEEEDDDPPAPIKKPEEEEDDPPAPKKEDEEDDDEEDDFDDFDDEDPPEPKEDEEEEEDLEEDDDDDDDEPRNIKTIRAKLKEEGGKRKAAEARNIELEEELERERAEKKKLEEKNKDIASNQINWNAHTQITPMWDKFDNIVNNGASTFSDAEQAKQFRKDSQGELLQAYYDLRKEAKTADQRLEADIKFKAQLSERYGVEDATPLVSTVREAMQQYIEIQDTVDDLKKKHEEGRLSVGVRAYEEGVKPFEDLFEDLGNVEEDYIETNPLSVEAVVGKKFAEDKEFRAKAEKQKDRIKQFVFGLRPLTQEELDKAERRASTKGMSVQEYLKQREQNYEKARRQFLNDVFYSGMAMEEFGEMRRIYDRYEKNKRKRENARKSIAKAKPTEKPNPPKKDEKPVKAKDKPWIPPTQRDFSKT